MERLVRFELFGQEFSYYTDASEEEVKEVVSLVRCELDDGEQGAKAGLPSNKMLILACLKIAARYVQLLKEYEQYRAQQGRSIDMLIDRVSTTMDDGPERK